MNINTQEVQKRAIEKLTNGKKTYNEGKTVPERQDGFKLFVEGIE